MKPFMISRIHALVLVGLGLWGYLQSASPSVTALIPVVFGVLIFVLNRGVYNGKKGYLISAIILTVLILGGLVMPLKGALGREDSEAVLRVVVMMLFTIVSLFALAYALASASRKE